MTNYDKWNLYFKHIGAPQSFIDWGFYSLIASSIQRRVWVGPESHQLFPNIYVVLCAEPGVGKGLVIGPVSELLRHHKKTNTDMGAPEAPKESKSGNATEVVGNSVFGDSRNKAYSFNNTLIPIGAHATTYQSLIKAMSLAYSSVEYFDHEAGRARAYMHSSLTFPLEEISSLFRTHTEDLARFLLEAYDCRPDYTYETIGRGLDRILKPCLNLLGGTTPKFMQRILDNSIIDEGFSSRTFFICEDRNRFNSIVFPDPTPDQVQAGIDILDHIKRLTKVYGRCTYEPEALSYLTTWWSKIDSTPRPNPNQKLNGYYARKNIHVQKLATIIHFSELSAFKGDNGHTTIDRVITLQEVMRAMDILNKAELKMHLAITFRGDSANAKRSSILLNALKSNDPAIKKELTKKEIHELLWDHLDNTEQLTELLDGMVSIGKLAEPVQRSSDGKMVYRLPD